LLEHTSADARFFLKVRRDTCLMRPIVMRAHAPRQTGRPSCSMTASQFAHLTVT
jgi:hypothetical protein